jgi:hypothetical protein
MKFLIHLVFYSGLALSARIIGSNNGVTLGSASSCFTKSCVESSCVCVNGKKDVTVDLSSCKGGSSISWICCDPNSSNACSDAQLSCEDGRVNDGKCEDDTIMYFKGIDASALEMSVQFHDGRLTGKLLFNCRDKFMFGR